MKTSIASTFTYRVTQLPDLECTEYHARYGDSPDDKLFELQDGFLHTVSTIARQYPLRCSLVYSYDPDEEITDKKLQIFIRLIFDEGLPNATTQQIEKIFESSFWKDFYGVKKCAPLSEISLNWVNTVTFGLKQEERISPTVKREGSPSHYYNIQPLEPRDSVDRVGFLSRLETYNSKAIVEIIIEPTCLTVQEEASFESFLRVLSDQSAYGIVTSQVSGNVRQKVIDPVADRTFRRFDTLREDIQTQALYEVSIRVLAKEQFIASLLLNELWVESSEKPLYRELPISTDSDLFQTALSAFQSGSLCPEAIWSQYWHRLSHNNPLLELKRLHRLFTTEEINSCFRIVVPDSAVLFNGIPKETDLKAIALKDSILLGWQSGKLQNQARIPVQKLNKHVFICGVPGSGKTTAVLNLLFQLWTEHRVPFLVIEPAKTEYRAMLKCTCDEAAIEQEQPTDGVFLSQAYAKARNVQSAIDAMSTDLSVYSLGNEQVCPFRFNPFAFYGSTTVDEHISTLEGCFKAGMPLGGPMAFLLAEGIEAAYAQHGWQPQDTADGGLEKHYLFPTMQELYDAISDILATKNYSADLSNDLQTALEVRIGGLLRRSVGNMMNTRISTPGIAELLQKPVILELDSLNEEQANLMTMFILASLREYAKVTRKSGSVLKHVVVIEEAHNIVGTDVEANSEEAANPKAEATKYIVRMLAEMRALGQGIIIADQLPSAVSPEVIKNTSTKIAHRTVSGDDRELLEQSMLLTTRQSEELARANPGDAYLFMEGTYRPVRVKEPNTKLIYGIEEPPSNQELVEHIRAQPFYQQALSARKSSTQIRAQLHNQDVQQQLSKLIESCTHAIYCSEQMVELSLLPQVGVTGLRKGKIELKKMLDDLGEVSLSTERKLNRIWSNTRQKGLFDTAISDPNVSHLRDTISRCQATMLSHRNKYEQHISSLRDRIKILQLEENQQRQLKSISESIVDSFEKYCKKIAQAKSEMLRTEPIALVEQTYQEAKAMRDRVDNIGNKLEQLTIEESNIDLADQVEMQLSKAQVSIATIEERIYLMYDEKY